MYIEEERRPGIFNAAYFVAALAVHAILFLAIWLVGIIRSDEDKEIVIPMDLMVVINENLDGVDGEPPPETSPVADPDPPPPDPPKEPPPPPSVEPDVAEAVIIEPDKPKPPKPPEPPKPAEPPKPPKKPDPPKKPEKTREQRMAEMRNRTTKIKTPPPRNNGRTEKRPPNWAELLNAGYEPGAENRGLDAGEEARCCSLDVITVENHKNRCAAEAAEHLSNDVTRDLSPAHTAADCCADCNCRVEMCTGSCAE